MWKTKVQNSGHSGFAVVRYSVHRVGLGGELRASRSFKLCLWSAIVHKKCILNYILPRKADYLRMS